MIIDDLIDILTDEFNLPVYRQGSMSDDATYPEEFFYSTDPDRTYSVIDTVAALLKSHGFTIDGRGHDVMSDEPTHTGRGIEVLYLQIGESGDLTFSDGEKTGRLVYRKLPTT